MKPHYLYPLLAHHMHNKNLEGRWGNSLPGELVSLYGYNRRHGRTCVSLSARCFIAGVLRVLEVMQELGLSGDVLM